MNDTFGCPRSKVATLDNFFSGQNNRGVYMRISEVKTNFRAAITVPEKSWQRFRDILSEYCDKIKQPSQGSGGGISSQDQPHSLVSHSFLLFVKIASFIIKGSANTAFLRLR